MKLEIFFYKAPQDSQKPEKNSGQSFENRTISGNPYYIFSTRGCPENK